MKKLKKYWKTADTEKAEREKESSLNYPKYEYKRSNIKEIKIIISEKKGMNISKNYPRDSPYPGDNFFLKRGI